jgi:hypothetical protein
MNVGIITASATIHGLIARGLTVSVAAGGSCDCGADGFVTGAAWTTSWRNLPVFDPVGLLFRSTDGSTISAATANCYFAMPTILRKCFFCSMASSINAATALRETVKPILGAAPSRLR